MRNFTELLPGLWRYDDSCNVYIVKRDDRAIAIDFGSGEWIERLPDLGVHALEHVFLTHHHADQCHGLAARDDWPFAIHAPDGEQRYLEPGRLGNDSKFDRKGKGCPASYAVLPDGLRDVRYDMGGFGHFMWGNCRLRFLSTPGHGQHACSVIIDFADTQVVFCGDAAYVDAGIWQPYHLEWDHWTGTGALAAWQGVIRLRDIHVDMLCPSHGAVIKRGVRSMLSELADKLMAYYHAKGSICADEPDIFVAPDEILPRGARKYGEHLYQFDNNSYLVISDSGETLVVDPFSTCLDNLDELLGALKLKPPSAALVSHYHFDHCEGINAMRERYGTKAILHESVAEPIANIETMMLPWLPKESIIADETWRGAGAWRWHEYVFDYRHWPGQTWWHCLFGTTIDGRRVAFAGDSYQPASQWNGTGGFCSYNNSRFLDGFVVSARSLIEWRPEIVAAGHKAVYRFRSSKFEKIMEWAHSAHDAVAALCPSRDLDSDYYRIPTNLPSRDRIYGSMFWG